MSRKSLIFVCPLLLAFACGEKKKFGADVAAASPSSEDVKTDENTTPAAQPAPIPASPASTTPAVIPTACGINKGDVTKVTLLSTGVNFALNNQTLKYELSVISCKDGSTVSINDLPVSFDLNLVSLNGFKTLSYSVQDTAGKSITSGDFTTVVGSDLFGNRGAFAHWVTKNVSYQSKLDKVILEINLKDIRLQSIDPDATTAESYLKVGDAAAVTQNLLILGQ